MSIKILNKKLKIKKNTLTKSKIYQEIRKIVYTKLNNGVITKNKANEIIDYIQNSKIKINSKKEGEKFAYKLKKLYPELETLIQKIEKEKDENKEKILAEILEEIIAKNDFDFLESILIDKDKVEKDQDELIQKIIKKYPEIKTKFKL